MDHISIILVNILYLEFCPTSGVRNECMNCVDACMHMIVSIIYVIIILINFHIVSLYFIRLCVFAPDGRSHE